MQDNNKGCPRVDAGGSESSDADLLDSAMMALRYYEMADRCKDEK